MHTRCIGAALLALLTSSPAHAADLAVGQTLSCASKDPNRRLTVVVGRVEPYGPFESVASVSLFVDDAKGASLGSASHLPIDAKVVATSCPTPAPKRALGDSFEEGYAQWKGAQGGVFTIPVDQIEAAVRQMLERARQPRTDT
jgi:hypothetical protein